MLRVNHPHRADESVAFAHHSFKKARLGGIVAQRRADFANDVVEVPFGIDKQVRAPEFFDDLFARNHLVAPANQKDQQLHGLFLKLYPAPKAPKFIAAKIEFHFANGLLCGPHVTECIPGKHYATNIQQLTAIHKRYINVIPYSLEWSRPAREDWLDR